MNKREKRRTYDSLMILWGVGLALTLTVAFSFQSWNKFEELAGKDLYLAILSIALSIVTLGLFFIYSIATYHELNIFGEYIEESEAPRVQPKNALAIFGLAILFGILIVFSHKIEIYSAIMVTYNLFDLWGGWQVRRTIGPILDKKLADSLDEEETDDLRTIKKFYFENPTMPRVVTLMYFNWAVFCLALTGILTDNRFFIYGAYLLLMLNLIAGEVVIHRWRFKSIYRLK